MPIRKLFHFMHIAGEFDQLSATYDALLAPRTYAPKGWSDFDKRWASLAVIGPDFVLEIMEPSKEPADGASPLPKFWNRHGDHLHSFAWYVDEDDFLSLAERMKDAGVHVVSPYGDLSDASTFFTHPKTTFGQLEFQAWSPDGRGAPHTAPDWDASYWADEFPLGLLGMSHLTTVVADLSEAQAFYEKVLDAPPFFEEKTEDRRSSFCLVGDDTVVEIAQPTTDDSRLANDLREHGQLPHAMTFRVKDIDAAVAHVQSCGVGFSQVGDTITVDPADVANAVVAFTTRELPNDPRR